MLNEVNLTNNPALTILNLYNNQLMAIDLTKNVHLVTLDLSYNQLRSIDLTRNAILVNLDLRNNALQMALDLSKNNQLTSFSLNFNRLSIVRLYYNTELTLNSIDLRNQQAEREKCEVEVAYGKLDEVKCKEFVNQLKANPYYKKYNFVIKANT
jgi:Leucine-rich repeat (LRR) protein